MIPFVNARLTEIRGSGTTDDYDTPATSGTVRWTGNVGIYCDDSRGTVISPQRQDEIDKTRLEIPYNVGRLIQRGDTLAFRFRDIDQTGVAFDLRGEPLVGRTRCLLEDR